VGWTIFPWRTGTPPDVVAVGDAASEPNQVRWLIGDTPSAALPIEPPAPDGYIGEVASIAALAGQVGVLGLWNFSTAP
jgi:hypothetical protein